jgi:hypothetical protein
MNRDPIWCGVTSGKLVDLGRPKLEDIEIDDIAWSLAHMARFNGHLIIQISVAQHSIYVSELVPEPLRLAALLHDAHEAYLGDIVRPVKRYLKEGGVDVDSLEGYWQNQIWKRYGCLPLDKGQEQVILEADDFQLAREIASFAPAGPFREFGQSALGNLTPARFTALLPQDVDPRRDYEAFKNRFFELFTVDHQRRTL